MEQQEINFKVLKELGFNVEYCDDSVFFDQYGYQWFIVEKSYLKGRISIDWDSTTRTCELRRVTKKGDITMRIPIKDQDELEMWDDFFSGKEQPFYA